MKYKVLVPASNGSGVIGEVLSTPLIGYTQTFIAIGSFDNLQECEAAFKYIKTKFCRVMLGICKVTQSCKRENWKYVPLQDFTANSDIDWTQNIREIDLQLYQKYKFTEEKIEFVESRVQSMG